MTAALGACRSMSAERISAARPDRVLFVGNSLTFFNDGLHTHYGNLLRAAGRRDSEQARVRQFTLAGARLRELAPTLPEIVGERGYDFVVLQGHSSEAIGTSTAAFHASVRRIVSTLRGSGCEVVLMMTWGFENRPEMTAALAASYRQIATELGVAVIPAGLAFERASRELPQVRLFKPDFARIESVDGQPRVRHQRDVKHPSLAGTYLMACTAYARLVGVSPVGNPYHADLDADTALALQAIAEAVVAEQHGSSAR